MEKHGLKYLDVHPGLSVYCRNGRKGSSKNFKAGVHRSLTVCSAEVEKGGS